MKINNFITKLKEKYENENNSDLKKKKSNNLKQKPESTIDEQNIEIKSSDHKTISSNEFNKRSIEFNNKKKLEEINELPSNKDISNINSTNEKTKRRQTLNEESYLNSIKKRLIEKIDLNYNKDEKEYLKIRAEFELLGDVSPTVGVIQEQEETPRKPIVKEKINVSENIKTKDVKLEQNQKDISDENNILNVENSFTYDYDNYYDKLFNDTQNNIDKVITEEVELIEEDNFESKIDEVLEITNGEKVTEEPLLLSGNIEEDINNITKTIEDKLDLDLSVLREDIDDYKQVIEDTIEEQITEEPKGKSLTEEIEMNISEIIDDEKTENIVIEESIDEDIDEQTKEYNYDEIKLNEKKNLDTMEIDSIADSLPEEIVDSTIEDELVETTNNWCLNYHLPTINENEDNVGEEFNFEEQEKEVLNSVGILNKLFATFNIEAKVSNYHIGSTITTYEISISPNIKVSRITSLENNIKLSLKARYVRIQAPIPGKDVIGIEAPNKILRKVEFKDIFLKSKKINKIDNSKLQVDLGEDVEGNILSFDLRNTPHLLLAGSTGSGKSVCMNTILLSLLLKYNPRDLKLVLVDPKMVEFSPYNNLPHLLTPVITNSQKAVETLSMLVEVMEKRYQTLLDNSVRNIAEYNQLMEQKGKEKMPFIVIVIDELADLMMTTAKEVESSIIRLTQKARAAGIHLIVATQRPTANIITGVIKTNIPSRIAFAVSSAIDSRTILDQMGAEKLLGKGDMLFSLTGSIPKRAQGSFIDIHFIKDIVEKCKIQCKPIYIETNIKDDNR